MRVARAGGVRTRGRRRDATPERRLRERKVERRDARPTAGSTDSTSLGAEGKFQTGFPAGRAYEDWGGPARLPTRRDMRAGDPNRVPSWLLAGEGDRGFVVTLHRDDDVPVGHLPPSKPKPPRVFPEEARLRAEAEALLARMSSEATRAKTLAAAAAAAAAASTRTIPAPRKSTARRDLSAPRAPPDPRKGEETPHAPTRLARARPANPARGTPSRPRASPATRASSASRARRSSARDVASRTRRRRASKPTRLVAVATSPSPQPPPPEPDALPRTPPRTPRDASRRPPRRPSRAYEANARPKTFHNRARTRVPVIPVVRVVRDNRVIRVPAATRSESLSTPSRNRIRRPTHRAKRSTRTSTKRPRHR